MSDKKNPNKSINMNENDETSAIDYLDENEEEISEDQIVTGTDIKSKSEGPSSLLELLKDSENSIDNFAENFNNVLKY